MTLQSLTPLASSAAVLWPHPEGSGVADAMIKTGDGFLIFGTQHMITGNIASANGGFGLAPGHSGLGFAVGGTGHLLTTNAASTNEAMGFFLSGTGHTVTGNATIGNQGFGMHIGSGGNATISKNNFYGNNIVADPNTGLTNCGLRNASGGSITATDNFWEAASGPDPDPADDICDDAGTGSTTVSVPFATKEFKIKLP